MRDQPCTGRCPHLCAQLEPRTLMSVVDAGPWPNDQLRSADDLGYLRTGATYVEYGDIGYDADGYVFRGSGDVDMVLFSLERRTVVDFDLSLLEGRTVGFGVLRLFDTYGDEIDSWIGVDRAERFELPAGDYFLGISGSGNSIYDPRDGHLTFASDTGAYTLRITTLGQPAPRSAVEFIETYRLAGYTGDEAVEALLDATADAWYGRADWGAENYWFQDEFGDVWSLWHGGDVHRRAGGEHDWQLTNVTAEAGYSGQLRIEPGSLSGVVTGWRAFSLQVVIGGELSALWWSPESSSGLYVDAYGYERFGRGLGRLGNGWVLDSITDAWVGTDGFTPYLGNIRAYTYSQPNGRGSFHPDADRAQNDGFSIVFVTNLGDPWVASFSITQRGLGASWLNQRWVVEPLWDTPAARSMSFDTIDFWIDEFDLRSR